jgi:hypothetical protein
MTDTPTHKLVDGELIELTPAEIEEIEQEWAAHEPTGPLVAVEKTNANS